MIPTGSRQRGRCARMLSAAVLCGMASVVYCGTTVFQQTPAQDRLFDSLFGGSSSGHSAGRPYNIPDVAGFGMYPLWKFHKFDGLSLRPVPYGLDIGTGLPPVPPSPSYPAGFPGNPGADPVYAPPVYVPPQKSNYGPPASPPTAAYEASAPSSYSSAPSSYSSSPSTYASTPSSYASSPSTYAAPQQAPQQSYGSQPSQNYATPNQQYGKAPADNYQAPVLNLGYTPVGYNEGPAPGGYNAPAAPSGYGEPQAPGYGGHQSGPSYQAPQPQQYGGQINPGYDAGSMQYGGNPLTLAFQPAQQEYGMHQQNYGSSPAGSFQMPTYAAIENPMSVSYPPAQESKTVQEPGFGGGGFLKRRSSNFDSEKDASSNGQSELDHTNPS